MPAFGEPEFFFEEGLRRLCQRAYDLHLVQDTNGDAMWSVNQ